MTHILIPAQNEADRIGRLLDAVPKHDTPIVLPNGCTDQTAEIAAGFGAIVLHQEDPGKMPALQAGLRFLGHRAIDGPVITADADCWPVFSERWSTTISQRLATVILNPTIEATSAVTVGPIVHRYGPGWASNLMRTALHYSREVRAAHGSNVGSWPGKNMGLWVGSEDVLEALLSIPHYWPGEDIAIKDTIVDAGGAAIKCLHPQAAVYSEARYDDGFFRQFLLTRGERIERSMTDYIGRGAEGSRPYPGLPSLKHMTDEPKSTAN